MDIYYLHMIGVKYQQKKLIILWQQKYKNMNPLIKKAKLRRLARNPHPMRMYFA